MTALTLHQDELANMFKLAPVSLWVEDLAAIHRADQQLSAEKRAFYEQIGFNRRQD
ncbi:MAG TPA: hypothetical protein PKE37_05375 [Thiomonas arsenitoxydans]|uniref:hypothetical protein n=1 Tax=Thiomonas TaxID=32012 RepID=UPI00257AE481|nr:MULTISPECIES: hypothetical protein [Thiomonas]HML81183.1 hypothetical protein [Thiomonas arsenitoxydans]